MLAPQKRVSDFGDGGQIDQVQVEETTPNLITSIIRLKQFRIKGRSFEFQEVFENPKSDTLVCKCLGDDGHEYVVKIIKLIDGIFPSNDPNDTYSDGYQVGEWRFAETVKQLFDSSVVTYEVSELIGEEIVLVSEYRGMDMKKYGKNKSGKLFLCEAIQILIRIANALCQLYKHNIIHSDIKPANIFITFEPTSYSFDVIDATLGDLGIARTVLSKGQPIYSSNIFSTPDTAHTYLTQHGTCGYIAPECFKGEQCLLSAVKKNGFAFEFVDELLRKDREIVLEAVKQNGYALEYADRSFRKDREIVLEAVKQNGRALEFVDESLRKDRDIVLEAVKQNVWALECADESLRKDREIVLELLRKDREIVLEAVKQNGWALEHVDKSLRKDREFVLEAVKQNGRALEYADESLRKDREFVLEAVKQNGHAFEYVDKSLRKDREFVLKAVKQNGCVFEYVDESLREIILEAVVNAETQKL
ncbi:predicted protein [Naegleria gruberi]|uniref:Predicted protein n=1 Tax=Naegleria gruberi TaxID=5762 RepID=D2V040_NAEGR|nr:uncharacterized protein NAEGRDRAFT_62160 [Naegleria gruberi]EFC49463.1 predicted protein [Naegleria gruberi]|eukprot:XP_002682207.1 predicted protein [Naegleria gruberi strain NEG-M]